LPVPVPASTISVFSPPSALLQTPRGTLLRLEHRGLRHRAARCFHRSGHGARHLDLRRTRPVAVDLARKQPVGGEDIGEFGRSLVTQRRGQRAAARCGLRRVLVGTRCSGVRRARRRCPGRWLKR
jgi:hypothetical protein